MISDDQEGFPLVCQPWGFPLGCVRPMVAPCYVCFGRNYGKLWEPVRDRVV